MWDNSATIEQDERNRITVWLINNNPDIAAVGDMPTWRGVIFALMHPKRFAVVVAMANAASAIYNGDHTKAA